MPTPIKEAILRWEAAHPDENIGEATYVGFQFQLPPIEKMDNTLSVLKNVQKLSLSTNSIDKIAGISSLKNLKILSLGRNMIKTFAGLDGVAETLEQLWISYNLIERTRGIDNLQKLKVLYISNNNIKLWSEFDRFANLPLLEDFLFNGNPLYENTDFDKYHAEVLRKIPTLKKLEGEPVVGMDEDEDDED